MTAFFQIIRQTIRRLAVGAIRGYRLLLSPVLPKSCRFYPSCSHYAIDAVETHGVVRGGWLATKRIARCHPWSAPDFDPVPGSALADELHRHHHHHKNA